MSLHHGLKMNETKVDTTGENEIEEHTPPQSSNKEREMKKVEWITFKDNPFKEVYASEPPSLWDEKKQTKENSASERPSPPSNEPKHHMKHTETKQNSKMQPAGLEEMKPSPSSKSASTEKDASNECNREKKKIRIETEAPPPPDPSPHHQRYRSNETALKPSKKGAPNKCNREKKNLSIETKVPPPPPPSPYRTNDTASMPSNYDRGLFKKTRNRTGRNRDREDFDETDPSNQSISEQPGAVLVTGPGGFQPRYNSIFPDQGSSPDIGSEVVVARAIGDEEIRDFIEDEVVERIKGQMAEAIEVEGTEESVEKGTCRQCRLMILCAILICVITVVVSIVATNETVTDTEKIVATNETVTDTEYLLDTFQPVSGDALFNEISNQYKSLSWLLGEDNANYDIRTADASELVERYVMVLLHFSTNGPNWMKPFNWTSTDSSVCNWHDGIHCNDDGRITALELFANNLTGTIPPELGYIEYLQHLSLAGNSITGIVPPGLGKLSILNFLDLAHNSLSGTIPTSLGSMGNLKLLNFLMNQLTGIIPDTIENLIWLEFADLGSNLLTGKIPIFPRNRLLDYLSLRDNALSGTIPESIYSLRSLSSLWMGYNLVSGTLSPLIGQLEELALLELTGSRMTGSLPTEFATLQSLAKLSVSDNEFSGSVPTEIGLLTKLELLGLRNNNFSGNIPSELGLLTNLIKLHLSDNMLSGSVPSTLLSLTSISE